MGYNVAEAAVSRGHSVTLISGPTKLCPPKVKKFISIESTDDLLTAVKREITKTDCLIMCAAVGDFKVKEFCNKKIKRQKTLSLMLEPNKDILAELYKYKKSGNLFVGFSLETEDIVKNSVLKLKQKKLDIIVGNRWQKRRNIFGDNKLDVHIIDRLGDITEVKHKTKQAIAHVLLDKIEEMW